MKTLWQNIEQYLLLSISLSFLGGILLYHLFSLSENVSTALAVLLFVPVFFFTKKSQSPWTIIFLLLLVCSLGFLHMAHHENNSVQEKTIYSRITEETDVVLSGTLHSMPLFDGEKTTLLIKSRYFREKQNADFSKVTGLVLVKLRERLQGSYKPGDELIIRCKLSRPYRFGNPGGFDYPAFLAAKDISLVGRSRSVAHFHPLQSEKTLLSRLQYLPEQIRCDIRDFLDKHLDKEPAAIYRALLIGDRSGIDKNRFETFKASGVVHIFAMICALQHYHSLSYNYSDI